MSLDIKKIRKDFPILSQEINGKKLVYLDNAATTQKPLVVLDKIDEVYTSYNANVHRGIYTLGILATRAMEEARKTVQHFIGAKSNKEVIFTSGTTGSMNMLAHCFCQSQCKPGDEILITAMEHHANIVPWQLQEEIRGIKLKVIPINEAGEISLKEVEKLISSKTKLISIAHVSNVLGTINPIEDLIELAHSKNIPVAIDAAQSVSHIPINVTKLDCDFLVFSAHKIYGPTGVGVLYGKEEWLEKFPPYQGGGEMIAHVSFEKTTFAELPYKMEAGTPNYVDIIAFIEAIKYVQKIGFAEIHKYETELLSLATEKLLEIEGLRIIGTAKHKSSVISILIKDIHPYDLVTLLDQYGIQVRSGHHCAQPLMGVFGIEGTLRASFAFYNTKEEVEYFVECLKKVVNILGVK
jgi:cysteine desulfurases, SufS subfamily